MKLDKLSEAHSKIRQYCIDHYITLVYPRELSACSMCRQQGKHIYMGNIENPDILIAAFCHEVGHIELEKSRKFRKVISKIPKLQLEIMAWNKGLEIMYNNFNITINNDIYQYMRGGLDSYANLKEEEFI